MTFFSDVAASSVLVLFVALISIQYDAVNMYMVQRYCEGEWHYWDHKITTFPGLYLLSAAIFSLLSLLSKHMLGVELGCSVVLLRLFNTGLAAVSPFLYSACRRKIEPASKDGPWTSLILFLYPINFFYYFLYYTDTASTLSIVLTYYLALCQIDGVESGGDRERNREKIGILGRKGRFGLGSQILLLLAGSASVLVRQTNAVWLLFIAGTAMISLLEKRTKFSDSHVPSIYKLIEFITQLVTYIPYLVLHTWPLLIPVVAFVVFVIVNKGIVVGDKEHHVPVYHLAMPLHFCVTYALLLVPSDVMSHVFRLRIKKERINEGIKEDGDHSSSVSSNKSNSNTKTDSDRNSNTSSISEKKITTASRIFHYCCHVCCFLLVTYVLLYSTLSHPFLLSDNRLFLAPFYYFCVVRTCTRLISDKGFIWTIVFSIAVIITLVPAHLLEFRYFTPAVVIAVINSPPVIINTASSRLNVYEKKDEMKGEMKDEDKDNEKKKREKREKDVEETKEISAVNGKITGSWDSYTSSYIAINSPQLFIILISCVINFIIIYVFIYRPFTWGDGSLARFMY